MSGRTFQFAAVSSAMAVTLLAGTLLAETHKEFHFTVGPKCGLSVNNPYGSVSVKPSSGNVVIVNANIASDKVEVDNSVVGNRVEIQSHLLAGADAQSGRIDYEIFAPADASITLHSSSGTLHAEKLHGDITLEGAAATVDVRDISSAHVHVKTLNGPVTLSNVQEGHVEVDSLSGNVTLNSVTGPLVQVISTSGWINYIGDFGDRGDYRLTSHSGDIEAIVPDNISADVSARSVRGEVHDDVHLQPRQHVPYTSTEGRAFWGTRGSPSTSSTVVLRTFSGKIHLSEHATKQ
jgi:DUF4097 and DUF4098 domain-containing protein YvlB